MNKEEIIKKQTETMEHYLGFARNLITNQADATDERVLQVAFSRVCLDLATERAAFVDALEETSKNIKELNTYVSAQSERIDEYDKNLRAALKAIEACEDDEIRAKLIEDSGNQKSGDSVQL